MTDRGETQRTQYAISCCTDKTGVSSSTANRAIAHRTVREDRSGQADGGLYVPAAATSPRAKSNGDAHAEITSVSRGAPTRGGAGVDSWHATRGTAAGRARTLLRHVMFGAVQSRSAARCTREGCTPGDTCVDASHYRAANATVFTLEADSNGTPPQLPQLPAGVIGVCKVQLVRNGARRHISVSWLQEDDDDSTGGENDDDCRLHYRR